LLASNDGWTVGHVAAEHAHLPADFNQWELTDDEGVTVAHVAAAHGHLPKNFTQWELSDGNGTTISHMAAMYAYLPSSFDQWGLRTKQMKSVLHYFLVYGHASDCYKELLARWAIEKPACRTEADWAVFGEELQEIYAKHTITEFMNGVDADDSTGASML
jgi:hypothetical protein